MVYGYIAIWYIVITPYGIYVYSYYAIWYIALVTNNLLFGFMVIWLYTIKVYSHITITMLLGKVSAT
jgi:hypothetical protein